MKKLIAAAAFVGLAASINAYAADDAVTQAKADYKAKKQECELLSTRDRSTCRREAKEKYTARLKEAKAEHRDTVQRHDEQGHESAIAGSRAD